MKMLRSMCLLGITTALCWQITAQNYDTNNVVVQTFAGSGFYGYYDGQGVLTMFNAPSAVAADSSGNLFVFDSGNARIRKITPDGTVTTFAGGGNGNPPGFGTNVSLSYGYSYGSMVIDHSNALWLATSSGYLIRIGPDAFVLPFYDNSFSYVGGLCVDSSNTLYYTSGNQIYRYTQSNGQSEVFAGSGNQGDIDGNWIFTSFNSPTALAADSADNIYAWDSGNKLIRRINQNRDVQTIAGTNYGYYYGNNVDGTGQAAEFAEVSAMAVDGSGNVFLACGTCVRKMTATTNVSTFAGSFTQTGYANGPGSAARFVYARGLCVAQGSIFVADSGDHRIRRIAFDPTPTMVTPANLGLRMLPSLSITGVVGRTYRIESSTTMSNWTFEATTLLTTNPQLWIDQGDSVQKKFYRTFLLP
jgi:hypothetical protein